MGVLLSRTGQKTIHYNKAERKMDRGRASKVSWSFKVIWSCLAAHRRWILLRLFVIEVLIVLFLSCNYSILSTKNFPLTKFSNMTELCRCFLELISSIGCHAKSSMFFCGEWLIRWLFLNHAKLLCSVGNSLSSLYSGVALIKKYFQFIKVVYWKLEPHFLNCLVVDFI